MLASAMVAILVHGEDLADRAKELAARRPELAVYGLGPMTVGTDWLQLARHAVDTLPSRRPEPDDVVLALDASGTTGKQMPRNTPNPAARRSG